MERFANFTDEVMAEHILRDLDYWVKSRPRLCETGSRKNVSSKIFMILSEKSCLFYHHLEKVDDLFF